MRPWLVLVIAACAHDVPRAATITPSAPTTAATTIAAGPSDAHADAEARDAEADAAAWTAKLGALTLTTSEHVDLPPLLPDPRRALVGVARIGDARASAGDALTSARRAMVARTDVLRACYERDLVRDPDLDGLRVIVRVGIAGGGEVVLAKVTQSKAPVRMNECVESAIAHIAFPPIGEPLAVVEATLHFDRRPPR